MKCKSKTGLKYALCHLKCRRDFLVREKLAGTFGVRNKQKFWSEVRRLNYVKRSYASSIDSKTDHQHILQIYSHLDKHS